MKDGRWMESLYRVSGFSLLVHLAVKGKKVIYWIAPHRHGGGSPMTRIAKDCSYTQLSGQASLCVPSVKGSPQYIV